MVAAWGWVIKGPNPKGSPAGATDAPASRKGRRGRRVLRAVLLLVVLLTAVGGFVIVNTWTVTGTRATGERLARMQASPQWQAGRFVDTVPRQDPKIVEAAWKWLTGGSSHREPSGDASFVPRGAADFATLPESGLRVTWLGHSTLLVEIDGRRVLIDPVWGERASPFTWAGPKRFHAPPLALADLPPVDAVVISHDHYDHLDYPTVLELARMEVLFVVPLGVGAHLAYWGVPTDRIVELDWWEEHALGELKLVATPARHFSGRSVVMADKDQTLWSGWALIGPRHRVYYSGDTAMFPGFRDIGQRLGPFDLTMIEAGAYNSLWADVHVGPEQAVEAHRMVRGKVMIPVHWGLFDLALHSWTEPVERVLAAAAERGVTVATPRPGESIEPAAGIPTARWWPHVPWQPAHEAPIVSSGLEAGLVGAPGAALDAGLLGE